MITLQLYTKGLKVISTLEQWLSNFSKHRNNLNGLLKYGLLGPAQGLWLSNSWSRPENVHSNNLSDHTDAAGLGYHILRNTT